MRHNNKGVILDRAKAPREMMLRNMVSSVLIYEKIQTTSAKAKAVKPLLEKVITTCKANDLNARRELLQLLPQKMAVKKALEVLSVRYADRKGGYARIIKIGRRQGDNAEMVQLELVS